MAETEAQKRLGRGLREHGYSVHGAPDVPAALALLAAEPIDLILAEQTEALADLAQLLHAGPTVLVIAAATGQPQKAEQARAAIAAGAYDYLVGPVSAAEVVLALEKAAAREARRGDPAASRFLAAEPRPLPGATPGDSARPAAPAALRDIVAESPRMRALLQQVHKLATHRTPVLISGESGTGKEVLAKMLHYLSPRRGEQLVAVNCGAMPETLLESLLFGHRRGAFTDAVRDQRGLFEDANRGTLFLDEVAELSSKLQVKLLRVLQDQKLLPLGAGAEEAITVDVRIVAATLRDLEAEVANGRFRADLYYRLSVVPLHVPPLRDRVEDILPLARHFLRRAAQRFSRPLSGFTAAAEQALKRYAWPGNVRELENMIERVAVLCEHTVLDDVDLPFLVPAGRDLKKELLQELNEDAPDLSIKRASRRLEAVLIERALLRTRGNRSAAARLLGLSHRALLYKIRDYDLDSKPLQKSGGKNSDH
jgi:two-component system response regulator AtoC